MEMFCNRINVFTVTFDQNIVSLLNKNTNSYIFKYLLYLIITHKHNININ